MSIEIKLPRPTEDELNMGKKIDYFTRIIDADYAKKFNITNEELSNWIHHNYQSIFLLNEELTYTKYKKLK